MRRSTQLPEHAADRTQGVANQPGPAGKPGIQTAEASVAAHAFGYSEDVLDWNPIAPGHGGIADRIYPLCSFFVKNAPVDCYSSINLI